jgi:hypothetical protein
MIDFSLVSRSDDSWWLFVWCFVHAHIRRVDGWLFVHLNIGRIDVSDFFFHSRVDFTWTIKSVDFNSRLVQIQWINSACFAKYSQSEMEILVRKASI